MIKTLDKKSGRELFILYPGDYFATDAKCFLGSVVGSCVVVCLHDQIKKIGGMNFLVIPGSIGTKEIYSDRIAAHGIAQMEYLLGEIVKLGGDRKNLIAKIFGAASGSETSGTKEFISINLLRFINEYFKSEKIPVHVDDLGGFYRRKVYFSPTDGGAYLKKLSNNIESSEFIKMEKEFIDNAFKNKDQYGKVVLFT